MVGVSNEISRPHATNVGLPKQAKPSCLREVVPQIRRELLGTYASGRMDTSMAKMFKRTANGGTTVRGQQPMSNQSCEGCWNVEAFPFMRRCGSTKEKEWLLDSKHEDDMCVGYLSLRP